MYSIENETLMITNRLEQETKFVNVAYNVADLVIPVGNGNAASMSQLGGTGCHRPTLLSQMATVFIRSTTTLLCRSVATDVPALVVPQAAR
ncbi:MAG UNVERIFIED_CONTAM: hypothetical protein LVR18_32805 [Planctomycetaceae bacterium]